MNTEHLVLKQIGTAHTPFKNMNEAPFQGRFSENIAAIEVFDEYVAGLKDVEAAAYLIVLYWAHLADRQTLQTLTPWGPEVRGVFACRAPSRPNPINLCTVELLRIDGNYLTVRGLDAVDGSIILDIKPYSSRIDSIAGVSIGWFQGEGEEGGVGST